MTEIVFMSGIPRSGSTLLINILGQNPYISVTGTSGLFDIVSAMRNQFTKSESINAQDETNMNDRFKRACSGCINGWASGDSGEGLYIDKNRGWPHYFEFLGLIGIRPKIIITLRDLRGVLTSLEKLYRKSNLRVTSISDKTSDILLTTEQRVHAWATEMPVGTAYNIVKDTYTRSINQQILFVRYEDLVKNEESANHTLKRIYEYMDKPFFPHDFGKITRLTKEDDRLHGIQGLHETEESLRPCSMDWDKIIGAQADEIVRSNIWYYRQFYPDLIRGDKLCA